MPDLEIDKFLFLLMNPINFDILHFLCDSENIGTQEGILFTSTKHTMDDLQKRFPTN